MIEIVIKITIKILMIMVIEILIKIKIEILIGILMIDKREEGRKWWWRVYIRPHPLY